MLLVVVPSFLFQVSVSRSCLPFSKFWTGPFFCSDIKTKTGFPAKTRRWPNKFTCTLKINSKTLVHFFEEKVLKDGKAIPWPAVTNQKNQPVLGHQVGAGPFEWNFAYQRKTPSIGSIGYIGIKGSPLSENWCFHWWTTEAYMISTSATSPTLFFSAQVTRDLSGKTGVLI